MCIDGLVGANRRHFLVRVTFLLLVSCVDCFENQIIYQGEKANAQIDAPSKQIKIDRPELFYKGNGVQIGRPWVKEEDNPYIGVNKTRDGHYVVVEGRQPKDELAFTSKQDLNQADGQTSILSSPSKEISDQKQSLIAFVNALKNAVSKEPSIKLQLANCLAEKWKGRLEQQFKSRQSLTSTTPFFKKPDHNTSQEKLFDENASNSTTSIHLLDGLFTVTEELNTRKLLTDKENLNKLIDSEINCTCEDQFLNWELQEFSAINENTDRAKSTMTSVSNATEEYVQTSSSSSSKSLDRNHLLKLFESVKLLGTTLGFEKVNGSVDGSSGLNKQDNSSSTDQLLDNNKSDPLMNYFTLISSLLDTKEEATILIDSLKSLSTPSNPSECIPNLTNELLSKFFEIFKLQTNEIQFEPGRSTPTLRLGTSWKTNMTNIALNSLINVLSKAQITAHGGKKKIMKYLKEGNRGPGLIFCPHCRHTFTIGAIPFPHKNTTRPPTPPPVLAVYF